MGRFLGPPLLGFRASSETEMSTVSAFSLYVVASKAKKATTRIPELTTKMPRMVKPRQRKRRRRDLCTGEAAGDFGGGSVFVLWRRTWLSWRLIAGFAKDAGAGMRCNSSRRTGPLTRERVNCCERHVWVMERRICIPVRPLNWRSDCIVGVMRRGTRRKGEACRGCDLIKSKYRELTQVEHA
jgi:hypothetical protein